MKGSLIHDVTTLDMEPSSEPAMQDRAGALAAFERFQRSVGENEYTNDEPRLPKGYRHIRSAVEAVLECSGEHVSS